MNQNEILLAEEMLEDAIDQLNLCIAEAKNDAIICGGNPSDYVGNYQYAECVKSVNIWKSEVNRLKATN